MPAAALEETLGAVRGQVGSLRTLVARTKAASLALKGRLRTQPSAEEGGGSGVEPGAARSCPEGCERHGNCNALTGECSCSLTHRGTACEVPTMPACELDSEGHVINLSLLASESFWCAARVRLRARGPFSPSSRRSPSGAQLARRGTRRAAAWTHRVAASAHGCGYRPVCACGCRWMLRDVRPGEERRTKPLHRWVGPVPCACVRQALAVFSLQNTPSPAEWPEYIGHLELALQVTGPAPAPLAPRPLALSPCLPARRRRRYCRTALATPLTTPLTTPLATPLTTPLTTPLHSASCVSSRLSPRGCCGSKGASSHVGHCSTRTCL